MEQTFTDLLDEYLATKIHLGLQQAGLDEEESLQISDDHEVAKLQLNAYIEGKDMV